MLEPTATVEGSIHVWKHMDDFRDRRSHAPAEHTSFRIEKGTKLSEVVAAASAAGLDSDTLAALGATTLTKARRPRVRNALRKAQSLSTAQALEIIVDRATARAILKARIAEAAGVECPLTEVERLAAALTLKAKHSTRHPETGQFIPIASKPQYTPGPDADQYGGAATHPVESGTGNPAPDRTAPTVAAWKHSGAVLESLRGS
jgi:hypothetical protein